MDNIETTQMSFDVLDGGDSSDVVTTSDVGKVAGLISEPFSDFVVLKVVVECVTFVDLGMRESDGSAIAGYDVRSFVGTNEFALNLDELGLGFSIFNFDGFESSLDVIEKSKVFVSLGDGDDVHDSNGELVVPSDFVINLNAVFLVLNDKRNFPTADGIVEMVSTL